MKTNSKIIGSSFEREVCHFLSEYLTDGSNSNIFCRTPASGLLGNKFNKLAGDILLIDESGKFKNDYIIECKSNRTGSIIPLKNPVKTNIKNCEQKYKELPWILIQKIRGNNDVYIISKIKFDSDIVAHIKDKDHTYYVYDFYNFDFKKIFLNHT